MSSCIIDSNKGRIAQIGGDNLANKALIGGGVLVSGLAAVISAWVIEGMIINSLRGFGIPQAAEDPIRAQLYLIIAPQIASVIGGVLAGIGITQ